jgi:cytochrome c556
MPHKSDFQLGMEKVLNNPKTSFLHNPKTYNEIQTQSGMSMNTMMKHIGGMARRQKKKPPTDAERSKERIDAMETAAK